MVWTNISRSAEGGPDGSRRCGVRVRKKYMKGTSEVDGRWMGGLLSLLCVWVFWGAAGWVVRVQMSPLGRRLARCFCLRLWVELPGSCRGLYVAVRGVSDVGGRAYVHIADGVATAGIA
jgi:hypothetical protein